MYTFHSFIILFMFLFSLKYKKGECFNVCEKPFGSKCFRCSLGYYLDDGDCYQCKKNCVGCNSYSSCSLCYAIRDII